MSVLVEVSVIIDSGCDNVKDAIEKFDDFGFDSGDMLIKSINGSSKVKIESYSVKDYIDSEEAC